jgi:hypothetical protein
VPKPWHFGRRVHFYWHVIGKFSARAVKLKRPPDNKFLR